MSRSAPLAIDPAAGKRPDPLTEYCRSALQLAETWIAQREDWTLRRHAGPLRQGIIETGGDDPMARKATLLMDVLGLISEIADAHERHAWGQVVGAAANALRASLFRREMN